MFVINCLHTAESNIAVFEAAHRALQRRDLRLQHRVRADLLAAAQRPDADLQRILADAAHELQALAADADAVLLTCSTLGPAADAARRASATPVIRVDEAFAAAATRAGGPVVVLCAVASTMAPTGALFEAAARDSGATIEMRLVPDAWDRFTAGDLDGYLALAAAAADAAASRNPGATIALAQASMAGAAGLCHTATPLVSPGAGLAAALQAAEKSSKQS